MQEKSMWQLGYVEAQNKTEEVYKVFYPEGTVGALIALLKKEDPNKQVFYVESHYDDYSCGDGYEYNFSQISSLDSSSIKGSIALQGDRKWEHDNEVPLNIYSLNDIGSVYVEYEGPYSSEDIMFTRTKRLTPRDFLYEYQEFCLPENSLVKVITNHYDFREVLVTMTEQQAYLWLLENDFVGEDF